jgi:hypothetical protein
MNDERHYVFQCYINGEEVTLSGTQAEIRKTLLERYNVDFYTWQRVPWEDKPIIVSPERLAYLIKEIREWAAELQDPNETSWNNKFGAELEEFMDYYLARQVLMTGSAEPSPFDTSESHPSKSD